VSENFLKDVMAEMEGVKPEPSGTVAKKKKEKKGKK